MSERTCFFPGFLVSIPKVAKYILVYDVIKSNFR